LLNGENAKSIARMHLKFSALQARPDVVLWERQTAASLSYIYIHVISIAMNLSRQKMNPRIPHILVVGSLNMDLVVQMPAIPGPGETLLGGRFATFPGGKGANQAVAAARLGAHVTMVGRVGSDAFGEQMLKIVNNEGIDTRFIGIDAQNATGVALITVDARGQNSIAVASGANFTLTPDEVRSAWEQIPQVDWLVMPLETPMDTIEAAAEIAKERGARVILNPAPARDLGEQLLEKIDVLIPNESETERLTGRKIQNDDDMHSAGVALLSLGVGSVVLTLGEKGALIVESYQEGPTFHSIPALSVPVVDTTAAGDAFVGALATGLGEGLSLSAAARFASAAAAISVTRAGAQPSLPYRNEVDRFMREGKL
jgi:ribokinase